VNSFPLTGFEDPSCHFVRQLMEKSWKGRMSRLLEQKAVSSQQSAKRQTLGLIAAILPKTYMSLEADPSLVRTPGRTKF
jgi:hypothetical protein